LKNSAENDAIRGGNMASETREQTREAPPRPVISGVTLVASGPRPARIVIDLSPEAEEMLKHLIDQTKDSPSDLFRKAIALYKVASESHRDGLKVGATKSADSLEAEFVGF
jgi:hypothetical protein